MLDTLARHIQRSGQYPPIIVRPLNDHLFQILDGHHRVQALRQLKHTTARCLIWSVDDAQALILLATLNRLSGADNPAKRGQLLAELTQHIPLPDIAPLLPEDRAVAEKLIDLSTSSPRLASPLPPDEQTIAVHFFLKPAERKRLDYTLRSLSPSRSQALMKLVDQHSA